MIFHQNKGKQKYGRSEAMNTNINLKNPIPGQTECALLRWMEK